MTFKSNANPVNIITDVGDIFNDFGDALSLQDVIDSVNTVTDSVEKSIGYLEKIWHAIEDFLLSFVADVDKFFEGSAAGNKLKECLESVFGDMSDVPSGFFVILDNILPFDVCEVFAIFDDIDIDQILDTFSSFDFRRRMLSNENGNSTRRLVETECGDDLCDPYEESWTSGWGYENFIVEQLKMFDLLPDEDINEVKKIYTDGNQYAYLNLAKHGLEMLYKVFEDILETLDFCDPIGEVKCPVQTVLFPLKELIYTVVFVFDYALNAADIHDGLVMATQQEAIFYNSETIINNQKSILDEVSALISEEAEKSRQLDINLFNLQNILLYYNDDRDDD
eukprot:304202_1